MADGRLAKWHELSRLYLMGAMYLTAMILRNALNCLNPTNTSQYFHLNPPLLEEWLAQGPNARPNVEAVIDIDDIDDDDD